MTDAAQPALFDLDVDVDLGVGAELAAPPGWPAPPAPAAWEPMAGMIAETIAPHTEADPVAILAQLLVGAGAVIGRGAWLAVEATRHHPNEFVVLVGESAKARKGSSWDHVARTLARADPGFAARVRTGCSTGEGLSGPPVTPTALTPAPATPACWWSSPSSSPCSRPPGAM